MKKENQLQSILNHFNFEGGKSSVYYQDLTSSREWGLREYQPMEAASLIKLPVLLTVMELMDRGKIRPDERIFIREEDRLPSCGVLTYMTQTKEAAVLDLCTLMIIVSDNTAANLLIRLVGMEAVNEWLTGHHCPGSRLRRLLFDSRAAAKGLENEVTARDMGVMLEQIFRKEVPGAEESLRMLMNQRLNGKIPVGLRDTRYPCAHKTGEDTGITHDAGIIFSPEPFILCLLTNQMPDVTEAEYRMHQVARALAGLSRETQTEKGGA